MNENFKNTFFVPEDMNGNTLVFLERTVPKEAFKVLGCAGPGDTTDFHNVYATVVQLLCKQDNVTKNSLEGHVTHNNNNILLYCYNV